MSVLVEQLKNGAPVIAAELRPPRAELATAASMDAWIDTYHAVRGLTRAGTFVFLTDSAVGMKEEDNLRHLVINLGSDVPRSHVVPFLTCKHTTEYCLAYADRARHNGFESLVILGGDKHVGPAACVEHAWQLREMIRTRESALALGGWANPHSNAATQVQHLLDDRVTAEFYLTQIVSHHSRPARRAVPRGRRAPRLDAARDVRRVLLPVGESAHAGDPARVPARSRRRAARGVRRGRDAGLGLRAIHPRAHGVRRAPLLRQQPSGWQSRVDVGASPRNGAKLNVWVTFSTAFPSPASSASAT